eukprot:4981480-Prymnesium_polylepis.1
MLTGWPPATGALGEQPSPAANRYRLGDHWSPSRSLLGGFAAAFLAEPFAGCRSEALVGHGADVG